MQTWVYDDGGRAAAGFRGQASDCVTRAIAIAAELDYREVYDMVNHYGATEATGRMRSAARLGPPMRAVRRLLGDLGWVWVPTMRVGQGCQVHLVGGELPGGRVIARVSGHLAAVVDGVVRDTHDPSRGGSRCVYGYWQAGS